MWFMLEMRGTQELRWEHLKDKEHYEHLGSLKMELQ
jgi:hypothetical protein